jgi:hypothetical protein
MQGIQDATYLRMLSDVADSHPSETIRLRASDLLQSVDQLVQTAPRSSIARWRHSLDDGTADAKRIEIGEFLESAIE